MVCIYYVIIPKSCVTIFFLQTSSVIQSKQTMSTSLSPTSQNDRLNLTKITWALITRTELVHNDFLFLFLHYNSLFSMVGKFQYIQKFGAA